MSKYKAGDKVVLDVLTSDDDGWYKIGGEYYSWWENPNYLDKVSEPLTKYTEKLEKKNQNKQKRIEKLVEKLHNQRDEINMLLEDKAELKAEVESARAACREEAWKLAGKIFDISDGGYSLKELEKVFGTDSIYECFINLTYSEAAAKVEAYENKKKKLNVGDVIESMEREEEYVVTCVADNFRSWNVAINKRGDYIVFKEESAGVKKTGRTLPVSDWLKQIGGEE